MPTVEEIIIRLNSYYITRRAEGKKTYLSPELIFEDSLWSADNRFKGGELFVRWFNAPKSFFAIRPGLIHLLQHSSNHVTPETIQKLFTQGDEYTLSGFESFGVPGNMFDRINAMYYRSINHEVYAQESRVPDAISSDPLFAIARAREFHERVRSEKLQEPTLKVLYLGAGRDLTQIQYFIEEVRQLDIQNNTTVYSRLQVIMSDYSPLIVEEAHQSAKEDPLCSKYLEEGKLFFKVIDALHPTEERVSWISSSYLYDSLSRTILAKVNETYYEILLRAYLQEGTFQLTDGTVISPEQFRHAFMIGDTEFLARCRPVCFENIRLEEMLVPVNIDALEHGSLLKTVLATAPDSTTELSTETYARMQRAINTLVKGGIFETYDLGIRDISQMDALDGRVKQIGAVYLGLNFPLLCAVASANGNVATYEPAMTYLERTFQTHIIPFFKMYGLIRDNPELASHYFPPHTHYHNTIPPELMTKLRRIYSECMWLFEGKHDSLFERSLAELGFNIPALRTHLFQHSAELNERVEYIRLLVEKS